MEKTNTQIIYELLSVQPLRSSELETQTTISKATLFRVLSAMVNEKIIRKVDGKYCVITPTPSVETILDKMVIYHQQKLMDYKYRRLNPEKQIDIITEWFIDSPTNLKGKVDDYIYDDLLNNITKASTKLYNQVI
jgi:DNA-binding HxlR family transcriptional regulator